MENKYIMFVNLTAETKKVYEKHFKEEGYQFLVNENGILLMKKQNANIEIAHEESIIQLIMNMSKKYLHEGILYLDLTTEINSILKKSEGKDKLNLSDNHITRPIKRAFEKAILNKKND